jgi:hypothetical protein
MLRGAVANARLKSSALIAFNCGSEKYKSPRLMSTNA